MREKNNKVMLFGYGKGDEARIGKGYGDVNFKTRQTLPKDETGIVTITQRRNQKGLQ